MIYESIHEWANHPVITSIDNVETPLTEVDFPTLTICHEPKYQTDNWALPELILNSFAFACTDTNNDCNITEALRKDFKPFLDFVFDQLSKMIEDTDFDQEAMEGKLGANHIDDVAEAINANLTTIEELESKMKNSLGKFHSHIDFIKKYVPLYNSTEPCLNGCHELKEKVLILLFKASTFAMKSHFGFGTLIRSYTGVLGKTFDYEDALMKKNRDVILCKDLTPTELKFHQIMNTFGNMVNMNISIYDLPSFLKIAPKMREIVEHRHHFPFYSLCLHSWRKGFTDTLKYAKLNSIPKYFLPSCIQEWEPILSNSDLPEENPFKKMPQHFCSKGITNLTGSDLKTIMFLMKFVYHAANESDAKLIHDLVKKTNCNYSMVEYENVFKYPRHFEYQSRRSNIINFTGTGDDFPSHNFQPVFTNVGLCHSWNKADFTNIFKTSTYLNTFRDVFEDENHENPIRKATYKRMTLYLDKHEWYLYDRVQPTHSFL